MILTQSCQMMRLIKSGSLSMTLMFLIIFGSSCVSVNKLKYFNDLDQLQEPVANPREQKVIGPFDRLYIRVYSIDEKTNQLFNSTENIPLNSSTNIITYQVDESGNVNYPLIGKINLGGLTTDKAGLKISAALSEYVTNAAVMVKFIESNITVLGEVHNQGIHTFSQDNLSIYEALALGGGITQFGNRKKVVLIRQEGNKLVHHKLDLTNSEISGKEFYYVRNNDIVVVEPIRSIAWYNFNSATFTTFFTTLLTIFSLWYIKKG